MKTVNFNYLITYKILICLKYSYNLFFKSIKQYFQRYYKIKNTVLYAILKKIN